MGSSLCAVNVILSSKKKFVINLFLCCAGLRVEFNMSSAAAAIDEPLYNNFYYYYIFAICIGFSFVALSLPTNSRPYYFYYFVGTAAVYNLLLFFKYIPDVSTQFYIIITIYFFSFFIIRDLTELLRLYE